MPHGLTVDFEGNIWLTDVGSHQVLKFNFQKNPFEPLLVIGEELTSGNDEYHFCKPTAVIVSRKTGDIFVADGYCNNRIAQFDKNGKFIKNYEDIKMPIQVAHSILLIENINIVCTVSRDEGR
jgi:peptidylamidoglycolate lyase